MNKVMTAMQLHEQGFNCCQSVFAAFSDSLGLSTAQALRISSSFGGGIRTGNVCGALTGALMAIGLYNGHDEANNPDEKQRVNEMTVTFIEAFQKKQNAILCKEILGYNPSIAEEKAIIDEKGLNKIKCPDAIKDAILLVEASIK